MDNKASKLPIYVQVLNSLGKQINKAQYFCPIFSFLVVGYTYYTIGRKSGTIWKYLFFVVTFGLIANILDMIKHISSQLNLHYNILIYLSWVSTYFYGLNEWGYVYINFKKIRTCVPLLKSKAWTVIMYIFLVYVLICRTIINYFKFTDDFISYFSNEEDTEKYGKKSLNLHTVIYIPTGILEIILSILVIKQYLKERNLTYRNETSVLFHSTLSRTLIISFVYIYIAFDTLFNDYPFIELLRKIFWRIKGIFGIIFLIDLLLLKIDVDQNKLFIQKELYDKKINFDIICHSQTQQINDSKNFNNSSSYQNSSSPTIIGNIDSLNRSHSFSKNFNQNSQTLPKNLNLSLDRNSTVSSIPLVPNHFYSEPLPQNYLNKNFSNC